MRGKKIILTEKQKQALEEIDVRKIAESFADKLLDFCAEHQITLHHLAELMECDAVTLYNWTSVRRHIPTLSHIIRVAIVTGMSIQELLEC